MLRLRYVAYRLGWGAVAIVVVTFLLFVLARQAPVLTDPTPGTTADGLLPDVELDLWDRDASLLTQYRQWLWSFLTLDWGISLRHGEPVGTLIRTRGRITLAYVLPGVIGGIGLSTALGYAAARRAGQWSDTTIRASSYLILAIPNFFIGAIAYAYLQRRLFELDAHFYDLGLGVTEGWNPVWLGIAVVIFTTHTAAVQLRYVRSQSSEQLAAPFVQTLAAKGASPRRTARHVLRAAAVPLLALFVAQVFAVLLVSVFVIEAVLAIPGLGFALWEAVLLNDVPLVLAVSTLLAGLVIGANLLEDILAAALDPRIERGDSA